MLSSRFRWTYTINQVKIDKLCSAEAEGTLRAGFESGALFITRSVIDGLLSAEVHIQPFCAGYLSTSMVFILQL